MHRAKGTNQCSDATLEEVLHVLTSQGYALAFPKYFKIGSPSIDLKTKYKNIKSTLAILTDAARGGIPRVPSVPKGGKFPAKVGIGLVDCPTQLICTWIFFIPLQS